MSHCDKGASPEGDRETDTVEQGSGTVLDFLWPEELTAAPHEQADAAADGSLSEALVRYASWLNGWGEEDIP